jgi:hypothetical protein
MTEEELPVEDGVEIADSDEDAAEVEADHDEAFAPDDDIEETADPPPDEDDQEGLADE